MFRRAVILCLLGLLPCLAQGQPLRIAVASNFAVPLHNLISHYRQTHPSETDISVSIGSTGKLYAQIQRGAPFDLFLAADTERPRRLVEAGLTLGGEEIYYVGRLALWHPKSPRPDELLNQLRASPRIAMANPKLAPYGLAAQQALGALDWQQTPSAQLITLENVGQTWAAVASGNATAGFVALSQLREQRTPETNFTLVPVILHDPISQAAVILKSSPQPEKAKRFLAFVQKNSGRLAP
ncbi:MAG: molybdate ABC transporter substrate-binding protein [Pseudomonadales bacterium]|nr:molybdate ABC transporter substrate-binding protein [Pseudomonadales bacterium]